jgi:glycine hydroxymethyltransferase
MHVIAAKAVAFKEALAPDFRGYCEQIVANAKALSDSVQGRDFRVVSGGTDNHLFLLSLIGRDTTGKAAQIALDRAGITTNKNMIPFDPEKPTITSGIRIGTPAVTTRGMSEAEMAIIGDLICRVLENPADVTALDAIREEAAELCRRFPLYLDRWNETD